MKPTPSIPTRRLTGAALKTLLLLGATSVLLPAYAASVFKANNTDNLNLGASWTGGTPPTAGDVAAWDATVTAANTNALGADTNWAGIQLTSVAGAVAITPNVNAAGVKVTSGSPTLTYSNAPANPLSDGSRAILTGTSAPGGFAFGPFYYVVNSTATTFQLSATPGGAAITPTTVGTNTLVTGPVLTLGASGVDTSASSFPLILTCPVFASAPQTWNLVSGVTVNGGLYGAAASGNDVTLGAGILTIGGTGMALSNLVVNSGATVSIGANGAGIVALNGGIFSVNGAIGEGLYVMAGGGTEQNTGGNRTWGGPLTGSGPLTVIASSTHTWSGNNTAYSGTLTLQGAGALRLSSTNSVSALTAYVFNGGTMNANQAGIFNLGSLSGTGNLNSAANQNFSIGALGGNTVFSGVIGGAGMIFKTGVGTLTLDGTSTYTGATVISNGVLQVGNNGNSGKLGTGIVTNYATLSLNRSDAAFSFTNTITGTGRFQQDGSGTTLLSGPAGGAGNNTYSGGTILNSGILKFTTGALGTGGVGFNNNATLQWASGNAADISSQTVTLSSGGGTVDVNGNIVTLANPIGNGGSGALTVKSSLPNGVLNLQGANTYSGGTYLSSGTLGANNASGSATGSGGVTVNGGTLAGTGIISGAVDVQGNGILAPGNGGVGTLTVGALTLEFGSTNNFEFNSTPANDKVVVTTAGGLVVNGGAFNLYTAGGITPWTTAGTYNLIQYSGSAPSLDDSWTTSSSSNPHVANPQTGYQYAFAASGGFLKVTLTVASTAVVGTWNADANGNWSDASKWSSNPKVPHAAGDSATFGAGTALRIVTLDANETVGAVAMNNNNSFVIADSGKTLSLDNSGSGASVNVSAGTANGIQTTMALNDNTAVSVGANGSLLISGGIGSATAKTLTVSGPGTLSLSGNNSYGPAAASGFGTTLSGTGILRVGHNNALGAGDVSVSANGTLQAGGAGLNVPNNLDLAPGVTATIDDNGNSFTLGGVISDGGALIKIGGGTLTLNGNNSYSGDTTISAGVLSVASAANIQNSANLILNGGDLLGNGTFTANNNVNIGLASGTVGTNALIDAASGQAFTLGGVIASAGNSGANNLVVNSGAGNNGTVILAGANTYGGTTVVSNGTLQIANSLALQNSTLVNNSGTVVFDGGINAATLGGLTGTNTLGLTNLNGGIIALTVGNNSASTIFGGGLDDGAVGGSLVKAGTGTFSLTGTNAYNGTTTANTGTLEVNGGSLVTSNTLTLNGGTLRLTNNGTINVPALDLGIGSSAPGTVVVYSGNASFGTTRISSGTINGGSITINGGTVSFDVLTDRRDASSGAATLNQGLIINGGATTVSNLFISTGNSGADMTVSNGSITIGDPTTTGGFIVGNGTSTARGGFLTVRGGTLSHLGADGLLLNNKSTSQGTALFGGGVSTLAGITLNNAADLAGGNASLTVGGGALYLGAVGLVANTQVGGATAAINLNTGLLGATADWACSAPLTLGGGFTVQAADAAGAGHAITLSGPISGAGGLIKTGAGRLTLSGPGAYSGSTIISNGVLALSGNAGLSNSATAITIAAPGVLDVSGSSPATFFLGTVTNQTLTGNGTIHGSLSVGGMGIVSPGFSIGTLTVDSAVVLGGVTVLELNRTNSPNSDQIASLSITAGGTLTVTNIGPGLQVGDTFHLFSTAVSGSFAATNLLAIDGANNLKYTWNNKLGVDGSIVVQSVASLINPNPTNITVSVSGGQITLSWPASHLGWVLQTNAVDLANPNLWFAYPGSAGLTSVVVTPDPAKTNVFYRLVKP